MLPSLPTSISHRLHRMSMATRLPKGDWKMSESWDYELLGKLSDMCDVSVREIKEIVKLLAKT